MADRQQALSVNRFAGFEGLGKLFGCFVALFGIAFSSIFFGVGCLFLYFIAIQPHLEFREVQNWQATACTITHSQIDQRNGGQAEIAYEYVIDGQTYTNDRIQITSMTTNNRDAAEKLAARYPVNSQQTCYYNPENPQQSILDRTTVPNLWWGLFPVPFILVGLVGYFVVFFKLRKWRQVSPIEEKLNQIQRASSQSTAGKASGSFQPLIAARTSTLSEWGDSDYDEEDLLEEPGPVSLQPESSPLLNGLGLLGMGAFWNGVVSVFVIQRIDDWMQFEFDGFADLFLVPFIVIGIGILLASLYYLLAAMNPRPTLTLSRQLIPLGGSATVQWLFENGIGSTRKLCVRLEGTESATYRRGTNTATDTETFYRQLVYETDAAYEIQAGQVEISIPADTMHSFDGGNNKIIWSLQLHGDVPFWPDIHLNFPIRVVPHE